MSGAYFGLAITRWFPGTTYVSTDSSTSSYSFPYINSYNLTTSITVTGLYTCKYGL